MFPPVNSRNKFCFIYVVYTLLVYGLQYSYTAILVTLGILISYLRLITVLKIGQYLWAKGIFFLMGKRIHIRGRENINKHKKYLLIANHTSIYDIPAIMTIIPRIAWIGRKYLVDIFGFGHLLKKIHFVPIEPGQREKSRESISRAIEHAQVGLTVAIFPEGTRTVTGELGPFKRGFVHIMRSAGLDVLPITLNGFFALKPKTRFHINPAARLEIIIHPVLKQADLSPLPDAEILEIAENAVRENHRNC